MSNKKINIYKNNNLKSFPLVRLGNKWKDIQYFFDFIPEDINTLYEGFGGTFALSRFLYGYNKNNPDKFNIKKFVICENDLVFLNNLKIIFNDIDKYHNFNIEINNLIGNKKFLFVNKKTPENNNNLNNLNNILNKYNYNCLNNDKNTLYVRGMVKRRTVKLTNNWKELKKLYDKIEFKNNFNDILNLNLNDNDFVFLDPPYFLSHNNSYNFELIDKETKIAKDNTGFYIDILNFMKSTPAKVMLIINNNELMKYIYKDFFKFEYKKQYGISKRVEFLGVYCNY